MATYYWVGHDYFWNGTNPNGWSLTSGGAGGAGVPGSTDDVIFDSNSGNAIISLDSWWETSAFCRNLDTTSFSGYIGQFQDRNGSFCRIYGDLIVGANAWFWLYTVQLLGKINPTVTIYKGNHNNNYFGYSNNEWCIGTFALHNSPGTLINLNVEYDSRCQNFWGIDTKQLITSPNCIVNPVTVPYQQIKAYIGTGSVFTLPDIGWNSEITAEANTRLETYSGRGLEYTTNVIDTLIAKPNVFPAYYGGSNGSGGPPTYNNLYLRTDANNANANEFRFANGVWNLKNLWIGGNIGSGITTVDSRDAITPFVINKTTPGIVECFDINLKNCKFTGVDGSYFYAGGNSTNNTTGVWKTTPTVGGFTVNVSAGGGYPVHMSEFNNTTGSDIYFMSYIQTTSVNVKMKATMYTGLSAYLFVRGHGTYGVDFTGIAIDFVFANGGINIVEFTGTNSLTGNVLLNVPGVYHSLQSVDIEITVSGTLLSFTTSLGENIQNFTIPAPTTYSNCGVCQRGYSRFVYPSIGNVTVTDLDTNTIIARDDFSDTIGTSMYDKPLDLLYTNSPNIRFRQAPSSKKMFMGGI